MADILTEHPRPSYRLAQFSDLHLTGDGTLLYGAADADGHLGELLAALEASGLRPDALVFSGDLADHGEHSAYQRLKELVEPAAARMGAAVVWATGNHDDRAALRPALLGGPATQDPIDYVVWVGGLRIVVLDTSVPGQHHGTVEPEQRAWLVEQLATAAPDGTILVMHHPPLPAVLDLAVTVELRGQRDLAPVLRGTDVTAILAGHVHYSTFGTFAGVPVSVASSTAYSQDLTVEAGGTRGRDGAQAFNLVDVYPGTVVHSVVPIGHYPTVGQFVGAAETRRRLVAGGFTVPAAVAR